MGRLKILTALFASFLAANPSLLAGEAACHASCEPSCAASCEPSCKVTDLLPACCDNPCCGQVADKCCSSTACPGCDECCEPLWTVRAGAIFLQRTNPNGPPIATILPGGAPALVPDNFSFDTGTGYDLYLRRRLSSGCSIELRYFEVDDISAAAGVAFPSSSIFIGGITVSPVSGIQSNYGSLLRSAEINLVGGADRWWNPIVGFRYVGFDDALSNGMSNGGPVLISYNVQTENQLYGGQLGFEGLLYRGERLTVDMWAKAGIYYNDVERTTALFFAGSNTAVFPTAAGEETAAFVGDLALNASYILTDHLALRAGYQLLWLTDVAEASNQGGPVLGDPLNTDGHPFYHGATVGVELTW